MVSVVDAARRQKNTLEKPWTERWFRSRPQLFCDNQRLISSACAREGPISQVDSNEFHDLLFRPADTADRSVRSHRDPDLIDASKLSILRCLSSNIVVRVEAPPIEGNPEILRKHPASMRRLPYPPARSSSLWQLLRGPAGIKDLSENRIQGSAQGKCESRPDGI